MIKLIIIFYFFIKIVSVQSWGYISDNINITYSQFSLYNKDFLSQYPADNYILMDNLTYENIISGESIFQHVLIDISVYEYKTFLYSLFSDCMENRFVETTIPTNQTVRHFMNCLFYDTYIMLDKFISAPFILLSNIHIGIQIYKIHIWTVHFLNYYPKHVFNEIFHMPIKSCLHLNQTHDINYLNKYILHTVITGNIHYQLFNFLNQTCIYNQIKDLQYELADNSIESSSLKRIVSSNFRKERELFFLRQTEYITLPQISNILNCNDTYTMINYYYFHIFKSLFVQFVKIDSNFEKYFEQPINQTSRINHILDIVSYHPSLYSFDDILSKEDRETLSHNINKRGIYGILPKKIKEPTLSEQELKFLSTIFSSSILSGKSESELLNKHLSWSNDPKCDLFLGDIAFTKKYSDLLVHRTKMTKLYNTFSKLTSADFFSKTNLVKLMIQTFRISGLRQFKLLNLLLKKPLKVLLDITSSEQFLLSEQIQQKYKGTFILNRDNTCLVKVAKESQFKPFLFLITSLFGGIKLTRRHNYLLDEVDILIENLFHDIKHGIIDYFELLKLVHLYTNKPVYKGGIFGRYLFTKDPMFRLFVLLQEPHIFSIFMDDALNLLDISN